MKKKLFLAAASMLLSCIKNPVVGMEIEKFSPSENHRSFVSKLRFSYMDCPSNMGFLPKDIQALFMAHLKGITHQDTLDALEEDVLKEKKRKKNYRVEKMGDGFKGCKRLHTFPASSVRAQKSLGFGEDLGSPGVLNFMEDLGSPISSNSLDFSTEEMREGETLSSIENITQFLEQTHLSYSERIENTTQLWDQTHFDVSTSGNSIHDLTMLLDQTRLESSEFLDNFPQLLDKTSSEEDFEMSSETTHSFQEEDIFVPRIQKKGGRIRSNSREGFSQEISSLKKGGSKKDARKSI